MATFESNLLPFEVIEDQSDDLRTGIEVVVYAHDDLFTPLDIISRRISPTFLNEVGRPGGGSLIVHALDPILKAVPSLLDYRNVVKCKIDQKVVGAFVLQGKKQIIVDPGENAKVGIQINGEGLRTWFNDAIVLPAGGLKRLSPQERVFSFASERGSWYHESDWTPAVNVAQYSLVPPDEGNTSPWGTAPAEWPDAPGAYWVWDRADTTPPVGFVYFRYEFDIDVSVGTKDYSLFSSGDDEFEVYVDAGRVTEVKEQNAYSQTYRADFTLDPGHHVIAARVRNTGGAGGFIAAFYRVGDATAVPPVPAELLSTTGTSGWLVNGYSDPAPGWSPGEVMLTLLNEAATRGVRMASTLVPTFTATLDSDGVAWPKPLDWTFDVGSTLTSVVEKLEELVCDVWIDPENYELNMAVERGQHRDVQTVGLQPIILEIAKNLLKAEEEGEAELKNALLMSVADGFEYHTDSLSDSGATYGLLEGYLSGQSSSSVSGDVAQAMFKKYSTPQKSATFKIVDLDEARPFRDFSEGDWVLAPGQGGLEPRRVMSISWSENSSGHLDFEMEFDSIMEDQGQRLERWLKTTSDGTLGGTVSNSGGGAGIPTPSTGLPKTGPQGPEGPEGPQGVPGVNWRGDWSSVTSYVEHDAVQHLGSAWIAIAPNVNIEPTALTTEWDLIAQGAGIVILGTLSNTSLLPTSGNKIGDAYIINGHIWVWNGSSWGDAGSIQGPAGATGDSGSSAYQVAVNNGFAGTETEWLASLKGIKGDPGTDGTDGVDGSPGASAYEVAVINGFTGTEAEWLASLEGSQGPEGPQGDTGPGLIIRGTLADTSALPATGTPGDAYVIDGNLWIWASTSASWENAGGITGSRQTITYTTASLASGAQEKSVIALGAGYNVLRIQLDGSARVRLYDTLAHQDADENRIPGTDPSFDAGVMMDFLSMSSGSWGLSPIPVGVNFESGSNVPITIDNLSGSSASVTVTITYRRTE